MMQRNYVRVADSIRRINTRRSDVHPTVKEWLERARRAYRKGSG